MKKSLIASLGLAMLAGVASAQFTIDGTKDAAYPATVTYQTNGTGYGDSSSGTIGTANGSELDGVYAQFVPGFLNIIFTGNLENGGNRLALFFDYDYNGAAGGQNTLRGDNAVIGAMNGLTFDTGFAPDFALIANIANGSNMYIDSTTLPTGAAGTGNYLGFGVAGGNGVLDSTGGNNPSNLLASFNNSNVGGVSGSSGTGADAVTTGLEFSIPTSLIGNVNYGTGVHIAAMITNGDGGYISNQILGGLPSGTANLDQAGGVNFNNYAGNQYFAVPEPASMAALGLGLIGIVSRRRRASK